MKKGLLILVAYIMLFVFSFVVYADNIEDLENQKIAIEEQQTHTINEINELQNQQQSILNQVPEVEKQIIESLAVSQALDEEIISLNQEIAIVENNLIAAEAQLDLEYQAMKKRIQYVYENNGNNGWALFLLSASDFSQMLNSEEYVSKLYKYDRECLDEYLNTLIIVENYRNELYEKNAELNVTKRELEEERKYLNDLLIGLNLSIEEYDKMISDANNLVSIYQNQIENMNQEIAAAIAEQQQVVQEQQVAASPQEPIQEENYEYFPSYSSGGGEDVVNFALQFVGNPYVWGGTSLTNGCDCSGFIQSVYAIFGYSLPRTSAQQRSAGRPVSVDEMIPGDILCYNGHVALYIGGTSIVHAADESLGIIVSNNFNYRDIIGIRRIIN